ncbi:MAG: FGGY-family carbohydrate kinase [Desulfuromusa sp.]|nr:FGGY-family carbohydrate kinase [Desulfuromusa sp.]
MALGEYLITYDIGTTGSKTCLYAFDSQMILIDSVLRDYSLHILAGGGAEQDPEEWWRAICESTRKILQRNSMDPQQIRGISFCCQMQSLVVVDKNGKHLRRSMSYMDQRAVKQKQEGISSGVCFSGYNAVRAISSLRITGGLAASVKDPLWKYKWLEENEPHIFEKIYKWLDVKEYLLMRSTGRFCMTEDSAFGTFLYDSRPGKKEWSHSLCRTFGVNPEHLPEIIAASENAGGLLAVAASELGLSAGTPVFGGAGDPSALALGSGAIDEGETHIYVGTSGWVSTVVKKRLVDINHFIASVISSRPGYYNYFAEQETSGKCLEWVKNHLALDEIGVYLDKIEITDRPEAQYRSMLDYLSDVIKDATPGCDGLIFTPWLHGNRSPFEDENVRGMFFNLSLETGKRAMIRSVVEGICFHKKWLLESIEKKAATSDSIRFVGGGAISDVTSQIMADIIERPIEAVADPQNAGAAGAAIICGVGLGLLSDFSEGKKAIKVRKVFTPKPENRDNYRRNFKAFKSLYYQNKRTFAQLNKQVNTG